MSYEILMFLSAVIGLVLFMVLVPLLKAKGLWVATLFAVNIIEQICHFLELHKYGAKKYKFVKKVLLTLSPKLTDDQIDSLIEDLVARLNQFKEGQP